MYVQLDIAHDKLPVLLCCLGIGTLKAIQEGLLPSNAGIWTLAVPRMSEPLSEFPSVPAELITVFRTCDELSAMEDLIPDKYPEELQKLIDRLGVVLQDVYQPDNPLWQVCWKKVDDPIYEDTYNLESLSDLQTP